MVKIGNKLMGEIEKIAFEINFNAMKTKGQELLQKGLSQGKEQFGNIQKAVQPHIEKAQQAYATHVPAKTRKEILKSGKIIRKDTGKMVSSGLNEFFSKNKIPFSIKLK